jgi:hypothetical protein
MAEQKKGLWSRLFGGGQGSCCNVRIEEVPDEEQTQARPPVANPCCGAAGSGTGGERRSGEAK